MANSLEITKGMRVLHATTDNSGTLSLTLDKNDEHGLAQRVTIHLTPTEADQLRTLGKD